MTRLLPLMALALLASACISERRVTDTPRTATEQLLVSGAIERAVAELAWPEVAGRAIALDVVALNAGDAPYLKAAAAGHARELGARVVAPDAAELTVTLLAGSIGTVSRAAKFGIPSFPTPFGVTPELPMLSSVRQRAYAKLQAQAHDGSGAHVFLGEPVLARVRFDVFRVLLLAIKTNDIYPDDSRVGID